MLLSAGNEGGAILPQAKKCHPNAVARAAAFRCLQREHDCKDAGGRATQGAVAEGSETLIVCRPGWRSQAEDPIMLSSAAAFRCLQREQGSETL
jgi:hypothetical protein